MYALSSSVEFYNSRSPSPILTDIPANAQRERDNSIRCAKEIPGNVRVYFTLIPRARAFKLFVIFTLSLANANMGCVDNIGLMPYRRRIVSVIGKPIHVKQNDKPRIEEVREIQELYIKELTWSVFSTSYVEYTDT